MVLYYLSTLVLNLESGILRLFSLIFINGCATRCKFTLIQREKNYFKVTKETLVIYLKKRLKKVELHVYFMHYIRVQCVPEYMCTLCIIYVYLIHVYHALNG